MSIEVGQRFNWQHGSVVEVTEVDAEGVHTVVVEPGTWISDELKEYVVRPVGERLVFVDDAEVMLGGAI